ncbi:MAG: NAD(P)/FAD-dependent oxidoreductase [Acidiferrobacter sp.]
MTDPLYDAVILGGGPAGATAGILLARAGLSIAILEQKPFPRPKVCGEFLSSISQRTLKEIGLEAAFAEAAGPPVRRLGLFTGKTVIVSERLRQGSSPGWGRALSRERLDTLLLDAAQQAGAALWQPWKALSVERDVDHYRCEARNALTHQQRVLKARLVIAAHGSWEHGALPTHPARRPPNEHDLLAFKAHFRETALPDDLMPLLAFPGGYGGMVHAEDGRVSLSCCLRRDLLARLRADSDQKTAGDAVGDYIQRHCRGVRQALQGARLEGHWLSAGPLRPGHQVQTTGSVFRIGNAMGEAHPLVAEGLSMAIQSAQMLAHCLTAPGDPFRDTQTAQRVADRYEIEWRRRFLGRIQAAAVFSRVAMSPWLTALTLPMLRLAPSLLQDLAQLAGKSDDAP